jgi:hypothetical protein
MSDNQTPPEGTDTEPTTTVITTTGSELSVEDLKAELAKVRKEAASRRVLTREQAEQLEEYKKLKEAQMSDLEKAQAKAVELQSALSAATQERAQIKAAKAAGLDLDWADRVKGESDEEMLEDAMKLAEMAGNKAPAGGSETFAGRRGGPVGVSANPNDDFRKWMLNN